MRRALTTLFAAILVAALPASGQITGWRTGGWEVEFGMCGSVYDDAFSEVHAKDHSSSYNTNTGRLNYDNYSHMLPTMWIRSGYSCPDTFVGLYLNVFGNYTYNDLTGGPSLLREQEVILHVLPEIRFYYLNESRYRFYASLGAGVRYRQFAETFEGDTITNHDFRFSYEISPFGVSMGDNWSFSVDLGYGTPWAIAKIGAGYRF